MDNKIEELLRIDFPLTCRIQKRLNRFVVSIKKDNRTHKLHINNTGRLEEFMVPGKKAFFFPTPHTEQTEGRLFAFFETNGGAIIDTQIQMRAFEQAVKKGLIPWLKSCRDFKRNVPLGRSLIDYAFYFSSGIVICEVKSAVLRQNGFALYPDCPSLRGRRHIKELTVWVKEGNRGIILFMAALQGIEAFTPNKEADPELADLLIKAQKIGVEIRAVGLFYDPLSSTIRLYHPDLPVFL